MAAIPRYRSHAGTALFSAGFRPFFLLGCLWAALAIPLWLLIFNGVTTETSVLAAAIWHAHEMIFGYAMATVAGFLLTAIPNWTGRMPLQGGPLAGLVLLWLAGRLAVLFSQTIGETTASAIDLAFPAVFLLVVAREIVAGKNWRNAPMVAALALLLLGNALVHAEALDLAETAGLGIRIGIATLTMLISLVGGRIVPSFTRNWLAKERPQGPPPAPAGRFDVATLVVTALALVVWVAAPESQAAPWLELVAGVCVGVRLLRWRGLAATAEPLLWILHVGYGWLAFGLLLLALNGFDPILPPTTALHALTAGAIGTMTLAVMTRASLGHTGHALTAGAGTTAIYVLVTLAAVVRVLAPLAGADYLPALIVAGAAWTAAFGLFVALYGPLLLRPRWSAS